MKKSVLLGSALLLLGLAVGVSSCNKSTEPSEHDFASNPDGNDTGAIVNPAAPGKVTISSSPAGSPVLDSARVSMSSSNAGDSIVYTTSGVDPIVTSPVYAGSFPITGTTTIKAAAVRNGKLGAVATLSITIITKLNKPSFSTSRVDTFSAPVTVTITPANGNTDTVFYTLSAAPGAPSRSSTRSSGTVNVTQSSYLVARSFYGNNDPSDPETTQVVLKVAKPTPSTKSGNSSNVFNLLFNSTSPGITVRFTRNGSMPSCTGTSSEIQKNSDSILVDSNQTITAIGCRDGWSASDTAKVSYKFKVGTVSTTPDSGVHETQPNVAFNSATPGATFFYTTDSTLPAWNAATMQPANASTAKWTSGDKLLGIQKSIWLRAVAVKSGWLNSDTMTTRFVYVGDSALIDNFELSGLGSKYGEKGLSWFACQNQAGIGCEQDQKYYLDRTLPLLDRSAADYNPLLGFRAWRVQVAIGQHSEDDHAGYAGCAVRVPDEYPGNAYRLVFWAKFQDTGSVSPRDSLPFIVEMAVKLNSQNNGGYSDGYHRKVMTVGSTWKQYEIDFTQFYSGGNGYGPARDQPDSTDDAPKLPALFSLDAGMPAIGLTRYQGAVTHNKFTPKWTWGVSKEASLSKGDITAFRFSVMQPMDPAVAATVGASPTHDPHEPSFTQTQLDALVKNIRGYLWIDNVRLVRKSVQ